MISDSLDAADEIDKIARNILVGSKAAGKFPTPVDEIIAYTDLSVATGVDLSRPQAGFLASTAEIFGRVSRKVLGMIDFRHKTIYLDQSQPPSRKNFVKLHEVGHGVLPWQRHLLGCQDDETTIAPEVEEIYEREASYFASSSLFQLDRFDEEAAKLPLSIASARVLAQMFGGSVQAALRRYAERSPKRCALLVFHKAQAGGSYCAKIRNYFESPSFFREFGGLPWPTECGLEFEFIKDMQRRRRDHQTGQICTTTRQLQLVTFNYDYFDNSYHVFVLLYPPGEKIATRTKIVVAS